MAARAFVDKAIASNKVLVFSKTYCPFCTKAKQALLQLLKPDQISVIEIENREDMDDIQDYLSQVTGGRSVPRVFIDGVFIGGGDDTAAKVRNGQLKAMLTQKGLV